LHEYHIGMVFILNLYQSDEWTQVQTVQSSLSVTRPSTNRAQRYLNSVTESPSKLWSPPWTSKYVKEDKVNIKKVGKY